MESKEQSFKLISDEYRRMNEQLHRSPRGFGADGHKWVSYVQEIIYKFKVKSLLDYGCGQQTLWKALRDSYGEWGELPSYVGYDPAIKGLSKVPSDPVDLVTCTDVLEHVEFEYLDNVVLHIRGLARKVAFFNINIHLANKILPDGRNAHLTLADRDWWGRYMKLMFGGSWELEELASKRIDKDYVILLRKVET